MCQLLLSARDAVMDEENKVSACRAYVLVTDTGMCAKRGEGSQQIH